MMNLLRQLNQQPRYHGNGMVQLYISPSERLHVHTAPNRTDHLHNARIHDHTFYMFSSVLSGDIEHILYDTIPHREGFYCVMSVGGSSKTGAEFTSLGRVVLTQTHHFHLTAGSSYEQSPGTFHQTKFHGEGGMTLISKTMTEKDRPRIVCPHGETPHNAFQEGGPTEDWMWSEIERKMSGLTDAARVLLHTTVVRSLREMEQ
jgi:hypothetical protein